MTLKIVDNILKSLHKDKILVMSWWWFRWLYTIWVLKWLEELWIDKDIPAVFGVSIGAIIWGLWCSGFTATDMYDIFMDELSIDKFYGKELFSRTGWVLPNKKIKSLLNKYIAEDFGKLTKKLYIWVVDTNTATYHLFDSGNLREIVLWSMSIPGVFPPVHYENYLFVDGGLLNNFPVDLAKKIYPHREIIWIALNKFEENQKISTSRWNLSVCYDIVMRAKLLENTKLVDHLFYRDINVPVLSLDKKKLQNAYKMWYDDCIKMFK